MKKILLIDDNEEFKEMLYEYFSHLSYNVFSSENGDAGIKKAVETKPDLIFLDVMMPDKTGLEVLRELQTCDDVSRTPVIVITGTYFEKDMKDLFMMEPNCKAFFPKSTELDILEKKLFELIGK